jgi:hypothetical protein
MTNDRRRSDLDRIAQGMIPFVQCNSHSEEPEWTPAHYQLGKVANLISCIVCLASYNEANIVWLTPEQASLRHGWSVVDSTPTSSPS